MKPTVLVYIDDDGETIIEASEGVRVIIVDELAGEDEARVGELEVERPLTEEDVRLIIGDSEIGTFYNDPADDADPFNLKAIDPPVTWLN